MRKWKKLSQQLAELRNQLYGFSDVIDRRLAKVEKKQDTLRAALAASHLHLKVKEEERKLPEHKENTHEKMEETCL